MYTAIQALNICLAAILPKLITNPITVHAKINGSLYTNTVTITQFLTSINIQYFVFLCLIMEV